MTILFAKPDGSDKASAMKSAVSKAPSVPAAVAGEASSAPAKRKRQAAVKVEFDLPAQDDVVEPASKRTRSRVAAKLNALQEPTAKTPKAKASSAAKAAMSDSPERPTVADLVDSIRDVAAYARLTYRELSGLEHSRDQTNETNALLQGRLNVAKHELSSATAALAEANQTIASLREANDALMSQLMVAHADLTIARSQADTQPAPAAVTDPVFFEDEEFDMSAFLKD